MVDFFLMCITEDHIRFALKIPIIEIRGHLCRRVTLSPDT